MGSSSTRGTWIEIDRFPCRSGRQQCRPPHGGRGLKCRVFDVTESLGLSSSTRGTWIEIDKRGAGGQGKWSSSARGTWIEIPSVSQFRPA